MYKKIKMKQNSDSSDSHSHILYGTLEKRRSKTNDNDDVTLYLALDSTRVLSIQNNEVSSVASNAVIAVNKITDENKNPGFKFFAVISSQESNSENSQHVAYVSNLKAVKRRGKNVIKMNASSNELNASGEYAENSTSLDDIHEGKVTVTILRLSAQSAVDSWEELVRLQNPSQIIGWSSLPGSAGNWTYLAFVSIGRIAVRNPFKENRFLFVRRVNNNIVEFAGFDADQLNQVLSFNHNLFGINDVANWRQRYGFRFQIFN